MMKRLYTYRRGKPPCLPNKGNHRGLPLRSLVGLTVLCCTAAIYADAVDPITQINSNADRIATQAQTNMTQQQQILAQRLQALSAAMQAQNPNSPIAVQQAPTSIQPAQPVAPPAAKVAPPVATTPSATGLKLPSQNNNNNSRNQWDYGF